MTRPQFPEPTLDELYDELVMLRTGRRDLTLMLLEGDDDFRFWFLRVDRRRCTLIPAHGKLSVERCVQFADQERLSGVLGVVDADLDALANLPRIASPNILITEDHDLEAMLLQSTALDGLLVELADHRRLTSFETAAGHGIRDALTARALPFARLRWLVHRGVCRIDRLEPVRFMREGWVLDLDELHVVAAREARLELSTLRGHLDELPEAPPWRLCRGHDILEILRIGLASVLGDRFQRSTHQLAGLLRQGFQGDEFRSCKLHSDVRAWEHRNAPYRVLPCGAMLPSS